MTRIVLSMLITLLTIPNPARAADTPASTASTATARTEVQAFVKSYVDAVNKADVSAAMEMISRKAGVTSIGDGEIARGWDAIRTDYDQIVGKEGSYKFSIGSIDVTPLGTSYALVVAPYTLTVATQQGDFQLPSAMTLVLLKSGKTWVILHEHMSSKAAGQEEGD